MAEERSTVEILKAARERISDPERWCRGAFAKNLSLKSVEPKDPSACRWCVLGAIEVESPGGLDYRSGFAEAAALVHEATSRITGKRGVWAQSLNDGNGEFSGFRRVHSHKLVLAALDAAVEDAEQDAKS